MTAAHDLRFSFPGHRVVVTVRRNTYDKGYGAREELVLATSSAAANLRRASAVTSASGRKAGD